MNHMIRGTVDIIFRTQPTPGCCCCCCRLGNPTPGSWVFVASQSPPLCWPIKGGLLGRAGGQKGGPWPEGSPAQRERPQRPQGTKPFGPRPLLSLLREDASSQLEADGDPWLEAGRCRRWTGEKSVDIGREKLVGSPCGSWMRPPVRG